MCATQGPFCGLWVSHSERACWDLEAGQARGMARRCRGQAPGPPGWDGPQASLGASSRRRSPYLSPAPPPRPCRNTARRRIYQRSGRNGSSVNTPRPGTSYKAPEPCALKRRRCRLLESRRTRSVSTTARGWVRPRRVETAAPPSSRFAMFIDPPPPLTTAPPPDPHRPTT